MGRAAESTEPLPVPSASEVTLLRAERLTAGERYHEALALLASIGHGDPQAGDADALRTAIQLELLAVAGEALDPSRVP